MGDQQLTRARYAQLSHFRLSTGSQGGLWRSKKEGRLLANGHLQIVKIVLTASDRCRQNYLDDFDLKFGQSQGSLPDLGQI